MTNHPLVRIIQMTISKYQRDNVGGLAAALAYFTIFSIFPLLLVVISLVGFVVDPERFNVQEQLLGLVGSPEVRELVAQTLAHFTRTRLGAGLLGAVTLLFAATGLFGVLTRTFKEIWGTRLNTGGGGIKMAVTTVVIDRLTAFALLLGVAALILVAVLGNVLISVLGAYTDWLPMNAVLLRLAQRVLGVALISLAFATLYKVLPGTNPQWRDVWPAALVAATLFIVLQQLAELIFSRVNYSSFGVLGGAMMLLLWIYISGQILLIGAELSYAWAHVVGSRKGAVEQQANMATPA